MQHDAGTFVSPTDATPLATYAWSAEDHRSVGAVQVAHGIAEHSGRYGRLADALVTAGFCVHAADHRGHGGSIGDGVPGDFGDPGFPGLVADVVAFGTDLRAQHEGRPLFLVAHSMGSFAAQQLLLDHSDLYDGVVLSGTTALDMLAGQLAGGDGPIGLEAFNAGFEHRTGYEWLSRDEDEVDRYVEDPWCGFELPDDAVPQLFGGAAELADATRLAGIRPELPVLLVSGQADPVSGDGQLVELVGQRYRDAGLHDVTTTIYPGARHEILNETNRDQITSDIVAWLRKQV